VFEYLYLPVSIIILILIIVVPIIFIYLFLRLSETAFEMVGFDHWHASLAVFGSVLGSLVDIPLGTVPLSAYPQWYVSLANMYPVAVSLTFHPVYLAVNVGGCIIPLVVSTHLLMRGRAPAGKAALGIMIVAVITYIAAMPVPREASLAHLVITNLAVITGLISPEVTVSADAGHQRHVRTFLGADIFMLLTPGVLPMFPLRAQISRLLSIGAGSSTASF
jgi:uncharacterized membrane protein